MKEAWIIDAARSPRGIGRVGKGSLVGIHPQRILAQLLEALTTRTGMDRKHIDDVIIACGTQFGEQGYCIARMAALDGGLDASVPGLTVDRFCGGGLSAVSLAAMAILSGQQQCVIAGGVESMSHSSTLPARGLVDSGNLHLRAIHPQPHQGICADLIATLEGISRVDVHQYAFSSQQRAAAAIENNWFARSIVPIHADDDRLALSRDEYPRPSTTLEGLATLKPAFAALYDASFDHTGETMRDLVERRYSGVEIHHVHHAGNSSGVVDGAAAVLVVSPDYAKAHGLRPRARIRAMTTVGVDPTLMLNGPVPATQRVLANAGMALKDIDLFEVNEAFAVVPLKFMRDLNIDPAQVNVNGGAIALGHPIGATGAMLVGTMLDELERRDESTGLITLCAAGGMAPAMIIDRI